MSVAQNNPAVDSRPAATAAEALAYFRDVVVPEHPEWSAEAHAARLATLAELDRIDVPLAERGRVESFGDLLNILIVALEPWGIEPEARSVSANGFTIRLQGHLVRVGFGVTMS